MDQSSVTESMTLSLSDPTTGDSFGLSYGDLDLNLIIKSVQDDGAGALALFVGTTRDNFNGER